MQAKFEQALEAVQSLSSQDYERLWCWMQERRRQESQTSLPNVVSRTEEQQTLLTRKWLTENRSSYLGEWVALDGDRLIGHGEEGRRVLAEAKASGVEHLFFDLITNEDVLFGGW